MTPPVGVEGSVRRVGRDRSWFLSPAQRRMPVKRDSPCSLLTAAITELGAQDSKYHTPKTSTNVRKTRDGDL